MRANVQADAYWWQGSLMEMKARSEPRGVPHTFAVESDGARALLVFTPGGIERMFEEGGVPAAESAEPPQNEYDVDAAIALAKRYGFEVVGPPLA